MENGFSSSKKKGAGITLLIGGAIVLLIVGLFGWLTKSPFVWIVGGLIFASGIGLIGGKKQGSGGSAVLISILWVVFAGFIKSLLWLVGVVGIVGGVLLIIKGKTEGV